MPKKVLVIEDNRMIIKLDEVLLGAKNYRVIQANDGKNGIRMAQEELPDVILLDVMLPGMDGMDVCRQLRADETTRRIPVVIVTSAGIDEVAARLGPEVAADAYLSKPYGIDELEDAMRKAAANRKAAME